MIQGVFCEVVLPRSTRVGPVKSRGVGAVNAKQLSGSFKIACRFLVLLEPLSCLAERPEEAPFAALRSHGFRLRTWSRRPTAKPARPNTYNNLRDYQKLMITFLLYVFFSRTTTIV